MLGFGLVFEVAVLGRGWRNFVWRLLLLHGGVTYQSDGKDLANGVEYSYQGAKVVS